MRRLLPAVVLLALLRTGVPVGADAAAAARDLKAKDVAKRLAAVEALRSDADAAAATWLLEALADEDWEVVERAALALGERSGPEALKPLLKLAVEGPVRRVREVAVRAVARLDPEAAAKDVVKDLRGDLAVRAAEALGLLGELTGERAGEQLRKAVERAVKSREAPVRAAAAAGLVALAPAERDEQWPRLLADEDVRVQAAALAAAARAADPARLPALLERLRAPVLCDVLERRVHAAIASIFGRLPAKEAAARADEMSLAMRSMKEPAVLGRHARLLGLLGAAPPPPAVPELAPAVPALAPAEALKALEPALVTRDDGVQACALQALGRLGLPEALERAAALGTSLAGPRAEGARLRVLVAGRGLGDEATLQAVALALGKSEHVGVREEAAFLLGRSGPDGAPFDAPAAALLGAWGDPDWAVAAVAAVSLGKTRSPRAVAALKGWIDPKGVKDWRRRGAAVAGLGQARQREAVPGLIAALADKDLCVRRTAFEHLRRLTKRQIVPEVEPWALWWEKVGPTYEFEDRAKEARELKKGGYAETPEDAFEAVGAVRQDVVVLQSRGDHIEQLLTVLKVAHRITRQAQVDEAELHPFAMFVSNCTGEIQAGDVQRLQWFVRVGGYAFCSCWALHHTVELVAPGRVRKLATKAEVLDLVDAERCPGESPFLAGVFPGFTRPTYVLFGAHLIEVLEPERVEVLIDSPDCAARWGEGNLACWFPVGHGVILDSANHFDLQGLERVTGLKTPQARMAYAMDHMGVDYPEFRRLAAEKVWDSQSDAAKAVRDLSAFRLVANFVRQKRRVDP